MDISKAITIPYKPKAKGTLPSGVEKPRSLYNFKVKTEGDEFIAWGKDCKSLTFEGCHAEDMAVLVSSFLDSPEFADETSFTGDLPVPTNDEKLKTYYAYFRPNHEVRGKVDVTAKVT
jgi:hypothetical protein